MTNISKAWTIQQKCEYMPRFGGRKKILRRLKRLNGVILAKATREWKTRNDGTINDHVHFFVIFESTVGKQQFVEGLFGESNRWLFRQARPVAKGSYKTFDDYLEPDPTKSKYQTSPGKVIYRYPKLLEDYGRILTSDRVVKDGVSKGGVKLFERLGIRIRDGEPITCMINDMPYLAIHLDKLLKIKGQFYRNVTKNVKIVESIPEGMTEFNIFNIHYIRSLDGMYPEFMNYVDQKVLMIKSRSRSDVIAFVNQIKFSNYVQINKWSVKWLYVEYVLIDDLGATTDGANGNESSDSNPSGTGSIHDLRQYGEWLLGEN